MPMVLMCNISLITLQHNTHKYNNSNYTLHSYHSWDFTSLIQELLNKEHSVIAHFQRTIWVEINSHRTCKKKYVIFRDG